METLSPSDSGGRRKYFVRERRILRVVGVNLAGNESFAYKIYSYVVVSLFIFAYPLVTGGDLFKHEFEIVATLYVYVVGSGMGSLIILVVFKERRKLGRLINILENEPYIPNPERGGDVEEKLIKDWHTFSVAQGLVFFAGVALSIGSRTVYTLMLRLRSSDYHDWGFSFGPLTVLNVTYSPNYEITWFYQNTGMIIIAASMSSCTVILAGILALLSVQFKVLQNNIARLLQNSYNLMLKDSYNSYEDTSEANALADPGSIPWKYLRICLKDAVLYHLDIMKILQEIENIFSLLMFSVFLCTLSLLCFEVYRASLYPMGNPRLLLVLVEAASVSFQVFMLCYCGQLVANESERVGKAAAEVNFVGADVRFQRALAFIMRKSQDPVIIKAGKFIDTSLVTFVWILRAAYSSFMMLRNVNNA